MSWDVDSGLWGADASGQVAVSTDAGQSWESRGTLAGTPQALLADGATLYAAVAESAAGDSTGIYESSDGGETWSLRYRDDG
jgi:photosystem II stability/assembly factor-like uncharacterized protein